MQQDPNSLQKEPDNDSALYYLGILQHFHLNKQAEALKHLHSASSSTLYLISTNNPHFLIVPMLERFCCGMRGMCVLYFWNRM